MLGAGPVSQFVYRAFEFLADDLFNSLMVDDPPLFVASSLPLLRESARIARTFPRPPHTPSPSDLLAISADANALGPHVLNCAPYAESASSASL